jgi:uncharacterized protein YjbI with pentapeptide repeats
MANDEHVAILKQGVAAWNAWRKENPDLRPDLRDMPRIQSLRGANLSKALLLRADLVGVQLNGANLYQAYMTQAMLLRADLSGADLSGAHLSEASLIEANLTKANLVKADLRATLFDADLTQANLSGANLTDAKVSRAKLVGANLTNANVSGANLYGANLNEANLHEANLYGANLTGANLNEANLNEANLTGANLTGANLNEANLRGAALYAAQLVDTDLTGADLTGCRIFGISAWRLKLEGAKQQNLVITAANEPTVTVDNIEVAQFIYLMLNNEKVRNVIDTITSKVVLILGRFTAERKAVLDALREELRKRNYLPILFDFEVPATRDITETISLLARMARFVVADITDAKSIPQELAEIVPHLPSVPVQPLLLEGSAEYGMFEHFRHYPWVLKMYTYPSSERLIANLGDCVIGPAEDYAKSIQ